MAYRPYLVAGDTNGVTDVYIKDMATGAMARLTPSAQPGPTNIFNTAATISADGNFITFASTVHILDSENPLSINDIFRIANPFVTPTYELVAGPAVQ